MVSEICFGDILLESGTEIFETMTTMPVERVSEPNQQTEEESLLASITFQGVIEGCLAIGCGSAAAKVITAKMLCLEPEEEIASKDISDALGEMTNMIIGGVKTRMHESVGDIQISIPTVVSGHELGGGLARKNKVLVQVVIDHSYPAVFSLWHREPSNISRRN